MFGDVAVGVSGIGSGLATRVLRKLTMPLGCVPVLLWPDAQIKNAMRRRVARPYIMDCVYVCLFSRTPCARRAIETNVKIAVVGVALSR